VLQSGAKDGGITAHCRERLAEFNLKEGVNLFDTETGDMRVFISSSSNGWMQRYHIPSLTLLQGERHQWKLCGMDNWFGFDDSQAHAAAENRVLAFHTPPKYSMVYNDLDIEFHGSLKRDQCMDRSADKANPDLIKFFRTKSGRLKSGTQELTMWNLIKRFRDHYYNSREFRDGMIKSSYKSGHGLKLDGSCDVHFLSHVFGHEVGQPPRLTDNLPMNAGGKERLNPFKTDIATIVDMKMKTGRKRHSTGQTAFTREGIRNIRQKLEKVEETMKEFVDPRIKFLKRVKKTAKRFAAVARALFGLSASDGFHSVDFKVQKELAR
jgi:hypothetical protein